MVSYVKEVNPNKKCVLLLNKADLLTVSQRKQWANYFHSKNIDFRYFSAYLERLAMEESQKAEKQDDDEDDIVKKPIVIPERNEDNDERKDECKFHHNASEGGMVRVTTEDVIVIQPTSPIVAEQV